MVSCIKSNVLQCNMIFNESVGREMSDWYEKPSRKKVVKGTVAMHAFPLEGRLEWTLAVINNITKTRLVFVLLVRRCKEGISSACGCCPFV